MWRGSPDESCSPTARVQGRTHPPPSPAGVPHPPNPREGRKPGGRGAVAGPHRWALSGPELEEEGKERTRTDNGETARDICMPQSLACLLSPSSLGWWASLCPSWHLSRGRKISPSPEGNRGAYHSVLALASAAGSPAGGSRRGARAMFIPSPKEKNPWNRLTGGEQSSALLKPVNIL